MLLKKSNYHTIPLPLRGGEWHLPEKALAFVEPVTGVWIKFHSFKKQALVGAACSAMD